MHCTQWQIFCWTILAYNKFTELIPITKVVSSIEQTSNAHITETLRNPVASERMLAHNVLANYACAVGKSIPSPVGNICNRRSGGVYRVILLTHW